MYPDSLSISEAAKKLGLHASTVRHRVRVAKRMGWLTVEGGGRGRAVRVRVDELDRLRTPAPALPSDAVLERAVQVAAELAQVSRQPRGKTREALKLRLGGATYAEAAEAAGLCGPEGGDGISGVQAAEARWFARYGLSRRDRAAEPGEDPAVGWRRHDILDLAEPKQPGQGQP